MLWLYDEFETDFTYNGIVLNNAYDSDIHWVLNTMYKLTFKYPTVDNDLYSFIEKGMIVKADEHDRTNLFRIKDIDISENDKCITVTAYQKNYDFSKRLVNNFGRLRVNCMSVLDEWYSNFLSSEKDFSYYSDINAINSFVSHNDDTDNKLRTSFELLGGIADTYSADIDMHDKQISLLERLGRDTEEVLTTAKNISEFVNTSNSDEIVTRIYASSTFKVGDKYDKKDLREQHRQQLKALRESQKEYSQGRNAVKKAQQMKDEIAKRYAKELAKNNKKVKRSGKVIKSYSQIESEVNAKYQARERKSQQRKAESQAIADRKKAEIESLKAQQKEELEALDEEITINLIVESPLINDYPFINEIAVSNNDLRTAEELEEWAMEYFTKQNIDKPKNSIKVTYEQLSEDINRGDTVILKYLKYGVDERIRVVETHYDPMSKKWKEFILGEKEGRLGSEVSSASSGAIAKANAYTDIITMDIERKVKERSENYDKLFKKNTDEINKKIEDGFEKATASSEVIKAKIDEDLEKKLAPIRNQVSTTVENYNRQFQATNLEISKNRVEATKQIQAANLEISKNRIEATKQIQVLSDRVNNMQDISSNSTVVELKKLVNEAKETGRSINQKVTELEGNVTREFTSVKAKNENDLKVIRGEIKTGVDGLTSKVSSLEEYKNQDGSRTESLKQWVQRDTANQLSSERTEINKIIDNKGFVKNTEFSSKFNENAQGINRQLTVLENYKNQDGTRISLLKQWTQENTASQLNSTRQGIERWVDGKGYATTSVVENKVQETANSISREIRNIRESIPTSVGGRNYITDSDKLTNINSGGTNWEKTVENGTLVFTKVRATESTGIWTQIMPFLKDNFQNEVLTWSVDVKASKNISFNNVGQETNGFKGRVDLTTNWQRISHTFTNRYSQHYAFVFYQMLGTCSPGDKVYVRLPKLEIGNVATDWTPAPEDNNAFVKNTEFSNKFNENAQGINRQLTALEQYKNQDSSRIETLKQWVQRDTANQLSRERTEIIRNVRDSIPTSIGGRNYIPNSGEPLQKEGHPWGGDWEVRTHPYYYNGNKKIMCLPNSTTRENFIRSSRFKLKRNTDYVISFKGFASTNVSSMDLHVLGRRNNETSDFTIFTRPAPLINSKRLSSSELEVVKNVRFNSGEMDEAFLRFDNNGSNNGQQAILFIAEVKLEEGTISTDWTPAPEDNNDFVKNTEFSSKFTESARGITNQLSALETYKNQDAVRVANMQIWAQNNTANQLTAARRSIESWVNEKGYATTSVVENKVQETANSFSREISNVRNSIPTSIGGRNYISNSNFAKDMENWELPRLNNSGLNWQKGHAIYHFGRGLHIWGTPNGEYKGLGTIPFSLTAKQGEKITVSMDLGKDALTAHSILFIGLHYIVDNDIVSQQWQTLDLATQNFEVKKYKRISKTFTVTADMNKCRLMIHTKANQLINFYIDNIKLEKGDISTDWTPAPEDVEQNVNELNTWKQTTNQTLNTVTSTLNDTVRHAQLRIGADGIDFGSNKVFNGRNLASILSVSPESIQAITDRLVISPANENLVKREYRDTFILNVRNGVLNRIYGSNIDLVGEYQFKVAIIDFDTPTLNASIHVKYKDGTDSWFNSEFPTPSIATLETSTSVKVQVESRKEIEYIEPLVFQNKWSDFYRFHLKKLFVGKKKSAELIVDGSIEGRQIKAETLETGHHKSGSITSEIIAANAVKAKHILIDDGLINNLVTHNAFISKLWAQDAFIRSLKTVKITSTQIDTETLRGVTITGATIDGGEIRGRTKIKLGEYGFMQPTSEGGLQINSPRRFNSKDGIGVQIIGATERGEDIPYGLFVYQDKDFTVGDRAVDTDSYIMTVQGFIRTKGINNLRFVNYRDASTSIGLWNKDVSLLFDNTDNDIYYSWKSKYSLWGIIKNFYNTTSDERLKKDIVTCDYKALDLINDFKFKSFNWKYHEEFGQKPYTEIGLIAQDVEKINKNFVAMAGEYKTLNQFNLLTYSLKAIQELSIQNKELQQKIIKLEEKING